MSLGVQVTGLRHFNLMCGSKIELHPKLHCARVTRIRHLPESRGCDVKAKRCEVRMVEYVENLPAQLEALGFTELDVFR